MSWPRRIIPCWTPARHAWLHTVARGVDTHRRGKGRTGCDCMRLGWTAWEWNRDHTRVLGERLTREGRRILRRWNVQHGCPAGVDTRQ